MPMLDPPEVACTGTIVLIDDGIVIAKGALAGKRPTFVSVSNC
jgi:hypothetical protein